MAAETGDLARIPPLFRQLCSNSFLKIVEILAQTALPALARSKSDRLLESLQFEI